MKEKTILRNLILILLVMCVVVSSTPIDYYAFDEDDPEYYMQGEGNTSTTYYKWMRIRSLEEVEDLVARYGKKTEYRCMLLCADFDKDPEEIAIFDTENYWNDRFVKPDLEDVPSIKYNEDIFYTKGGLMTPYIEFLGLDSNDIAGEGEKVKLYTPNRADKKTSTLVCNTTDDDDPRMYLTDESKFNGIFDESIAYDYWLMSFPEQSNGNYMGLARSGHEFVGFCMPKVNNIEGVPDTPWLTWDYAYAADYHLSLTPERNDDREDKAVMLYECYIGIPIEQNRVKENETIYIKDNTTVVWDDCSINSGTINVESGGTLIISGTCINNGRIYVSYGGKVILQKGALVMPLEPHMEYNACITALRDGTIIIREGARVIGAYKKTQTYVIRVEDKGTLVNYGYILGESTGIYRANGSRYIKSSSGLQKLLMFNFKPGHDLLAGYDRNDPYSTMEDYLKAIHSECYQILHIAKDSGAGYLAAENR